MTSSLGDGPNCSVKEHGRTYIIDGKPWCPHSDHTSRGVRRDAIPAPDRKALIAAARTRRERAKRTPAPSTESPSPQPGPQGP